MRRVASILLLLIAPLFASDKANETLHINVYQGIVTLAWSESSTGVTSYNVYRSTISGGYYSKIGSSTTMGYVDKGATPGFIYYVVTAVNPASTPPESAYSEQVSASLE